MARPALHYRGAFNSEPLLCARRILCVAMVWFFQRKKLLMFNRCLRVPFVPSQPVQYRSAPVFPCLAVCPEVDIHVAYCNLSRAEATNDTDFQSALQWDVPLLDGYSWSHVSSRGSSKVSFFGLRNPDLWGLTHKGECAAVISHVGHAQSSFWIVYSAARLRGATFLFGTDATLVAPLDARTWKIRFTRILCFHLFSLAYQVMTPSTAGRDFVAYGHCSAGI